MAIDTTTSVDVQTLTPFKKFIMTIGALPTSYLESMTYAELLMWFCNYLQETVIPTVNNNAEAVEELQGLYEELKSYVNHYFDNLNVQDEINNKLDTMAANGTLTQLIGNYVDPIIEQQNALIENLQQQINSVVTNPPKAVDSTSDMTDQDQIYILTTDGKWYYYDTNESDWVAGGDYQSTSFNDLIQIKPATINIQGYLSTSGYINTTSGFMRSDYIPVLDGKTYITGELISPSSAILLVAGYDTEKNLIYKFIGEEGTNNINIEIPEGVKFIIVSSKTGGDYYINVNLNGVSYMNLNNSLSQNKQYVAIRTQGYINTSGVLNPTSGFYSTEFIPCSYGEIIKGHIIGVRDAILYLSYYDGNKQLIKSYKGGADDGNFEVNLNEIVPYDAKYFRLSSKWNNTTDYYLYAYKIVNALDWTKFINTKEENVEMYVDASLTSGQYDEVTTFNSLTACLLKINENNDDKLYDVHVKAGEYDLYEEMGGLEFLQSVTVDDTAYTINQPWLYNVNLIGEGNVILKYLPSDEDVTEYPLASDLYSPLNVRGNVNIENIEIQCQNCRYGIHDETGGIAKYNNTYHNYKNVKVNYIKGISYGNGLGGGFDNGQTYIFDSCYFKSTRSYAWSYHNRTSTGGNFIVNNCIFIGNGYSDRSIKLSNVGTQNKSVANFNNCYFNKDIGLTKESDGTPSTNCYQVYLLGCNDINIEVEDSLGTNLYDPVIYNTIE